MHSLFYQLSLPHHPQLYVYRIDKHELNVVKLFIRRITARFTEYVLMHQSHVDTQGYYIKGGNA